MERLQKVMSKAGVASRRESEKLITAGKVTVNGTVVTELGVKVDEGKDRIAVDGKFIEREAYVYFLLHKPRGIIASAKDEKSRKTVVDLLTDVKERVYPVGRLDYDTEGLLVMTNDGELTHHLIHPKFEIQKTYLAKVRGVPAEEALDRLRVGVRLEDGVTQPALIEKVQADAQKNLTTVEIVIHEGKNRQVRRMFEKIGYPVVSLKRTKFAMLTLDGVRRGQYRPLTESEVTALKGLE